MGILRILKILRTSGTPYELGVSWVAVRTTGLDGNPLYAAALTVPNSRRDSANAIRISGRIAKSP